MNGFSRNVNRWIVLLTISLIGCSRGPATVAVSGKVTVNGTDLPGGSIQFFPAAGSFVGTMVNSDGTFALKLEPGSYQVAIQESVNLPENWQHGDLVPKTKPLLPSKYSIHRSSGLTAEIEDGIRTKTVDFDLK